MNENLEFFSNQIYEHIKLVFKSKPENLSFIKNTDYITGLTILFRFVNSRVVPWQKQNVTPTKYFKQDLAKITDKRIKKKIDELITALSCGDPILNDTSLDKEYRFAPLSIDKFFSKNDSELTKYRCDFLLELFGIQHYHVGYDKNTDNTLVFVWRDWLAGRNLLLGIGNHDDIMLQSNNNHIREAMNNNLPQEITELLFFKSQLYNPSYVPSDDEIKKLRDEGINSPFFDSASGEIYITPSVSLSKIPEFVEFFIEGMKRDISLLFTEIGSGKFIDLIIETNRALINVIGEDGKKHTSFVNLDKPDLKDSYIGKLLLIFRRVRQILNVF